MEIREILEIKRPSGGRGQAALLKKLKKKYCAEYVKDGGLIVNLGGQCVFTSHLDTMEHEEGRNALTEKDGILSVEGGGILGADDGAGVYIMTKMIEANIPGVYLFTMDEEIGSKKGINLLDTRGAEYAIAFDRRGQTDLCIAQMGEKLASYHFGEQIAEAFGFEMCRGIYTDNFNLKGKITEIVNLSVGYMDEHTERESLDLIYLEEMTKKCLEFDWEGLYGEGPLREMAEMLGEEEEFWFQ